MRLDESEFVRLAAQYPIKQGHGHARHHDDEDAAPECHGLHDCNLVSRTPVSFYASLTNSDSVSSPRFG